ncbi:hypothetical protein BaRGS_00031300 [Batillaria attramentaria]|uniref:Uncharacterized protein n=1 Tax=Batillaria attramentaria TaxID=370345 RepID=A0ABD0JRD8_9CAEN
MAESDDQTCGYTEGNVLVIIDLAGLISVQRDPFTALYSSAPRQCTWLLPPFPAHAQWCVNSLGTLTYAESDVMSGCTRTGGLDSRNVVCVDRGKAGRLYK